MVLVLRDYQTEAVQSFFDFVRSGGRSPCIRVPTAGGKSLIIADICKTMITKWHSTRVLIVTHTKELIAQNEAEFKSYYPNASTGIYSAGLNKRHTDRRVIFAGVQSIYRRAFDFNKIDLLIIDEAHLVNTEAGTQYARLIKDLKTANPNIVILGLSATPYRLDNGLLYEGEKRLFESLIYDIDICDLIREGYLAPVISKGSTEKINLKGVKKTAGDYNKKSLEAAVDKDFLTKKAVDEIIDLGKTRVSWLVYASGIKHAQHICEEIRSRGIQCEVVTGETETTKRDQILADFKAQRLRCLVNVEILIAGFNAPCTDLLVLLMATQSTSKYVQAVGRGTRICPGKDNCLLLDFGGNVERHGPIDAVNPKFKEKGEGTGIAPGKECPICATVVHTTVRVCPDCGHEFPPPESNLEQTSYDGAVLSTQEEAKWYEVLEVGYNIWAGKNGKPNTLRCDFYTSHRQQPYSKWLPLDHPGTAHNISLKYVEICGGKAETVERAYKESFNWVDPTAIQVQRDPKNKKYWIITGYNFPDKIPTENNILI